MNTLMYLYSAAAATTIAKALQVSDESLDPTGTQDSLHVPCDDLVLQHASVLVTFKDGWWHIITWLWNAESPDLPDNFDLSLVGQLTVPVHNSRLGQSALTK